MHRSKSATVSTSIEILWAGLTVFKTTHGLQVRRGKQVYRLGRPPYFIRPLSDGGIRPLLSIEIVTVEYWNWLAW
jgi:hypothetical protein